MALEPLDIQALVVVRELFNGDTVAFPVGDPQIVSYDEDEDDAVLELALFLKEHLAAIEADRIAGFIFPEDTELIDVEVVVPRHDLDRRVQIQIPLAIPCVVIPSGSDTWVNILPIAHTFFLERGEDLAEAVEREVKRMTSARELDATEYLALLPAADQRIERVEVELLRDEHQDRAALASKRRAMDKKKRRHEAIETLREVGTSLRHEWASSKNASFVGREREVEMLRTLMSAAEPMSVAIVGEPGCGKTALMRHVLMGMPAGKQRTVIATSGAQLIAGQSGFGQWQERLFRVMEAAEILDAVLYFDDLADLFSGQVGGIMDMAGAMRPYLEDGRVRIIGELTPEAMGLYEHRHVGFFSNMHRVRVEPMSTSETAEVLEALRRHHRKHSARRPVLASKAVLPLVDLADRYLPYQAFPGKAVQLIEELCTMRESHYSPGGEVVEVTESDVFEAFSQRTGIPVFLLREDRAVKHDEILETFRARVIGQHEACQRIADTLCVVKAKLQAPEKPLATLLFVGPTGVGKTEVAKTLARFLFGGADRLVRFDMSEYMDALAAERLIRGTDRAEGELTRRVRQQPFCAILLDEIEKAHSSVFDLLLQVAGEGRLTDARGKTALFHNAIIIMTSNLGAAHRRESLGFGDATAAADADRSYYAEQVHRAFRPEFVNRLDAVIPFHVLDADQIHDVAEVVLERIREREGLSEQGVSLEVSPAAMAELSCEGYSPEYGARALRRHLDDHLVAPISRLLSCHADVSQGGDVTVFVDGEERPDGAPELSRRVRVEQHGALMFELSRTARLSNKRDSYGMSLISSLRRSATRAFELGRIEQVRDRMAFVQAQLNYGNSKKKRKKKNQRSALAMAELHQEFHRLTEAYGALDAPRVEIEEIEELAIGALLEGEALEGLSGEAVKAHAQFMNKLVYALLCTEPKRDQITLLARRVQGDGAFGMWLPGLLEEAEARSWSVGLHFDGDSSAEWPDDIRFGPRRPATTPQVRDPEHLARWRNILVSVKGPYAGVMLAMETGGIRYVRIGGRDEQALLWIENMGMRSSLTRKDFSRALSVFALDVDRIVRTTPTRTVDLFHRSIVNGRSGETLDVEPDAYWSAYESLVIDDLLQLIRTNTSLARTFHGPLDLVRPEED